MDLSRTISEINSDFSRQSQNPPSCILRPPLKGFFLELGIARHQKIEWRGYRDKKEVWRYLHPSGYNTPTWQTDRQTRERWTPGDSKDRAYRRAR